MHKKIIPFLFVILSLIFNASFSANADVDVDNTAENALYLVVGELETFAIESMTRVSVADPEIADVAEVDETGMLVIGKTVGQTDIFYWDSSGKNTVRVYVYGEELDLVNDRIARLLKSAEIDSIKLETNEKEGKVVVSGNVPKYQKDKFEKLIEPFEEKVINLSTPEDVDNLIQVDMQISELSTTLVKQLGIDWFTGEQTVDDEGNIETETSDDFNPGFGEILPPLDDRKNSKIFNVGDFARFNNSALVAKVNALIEEGKGRVLSRPKLVVVSGEEASFLVGGEIPIRSTAVSDGQAVETVTYKNYGIGMTVTPTVKKEKIDVILNVEISDIDRATPIGATAAGDIAFTTRTAQTRLLLENRETVVLAGLIKNAEGETIRRIPFLSKIPLAGLLFRSKKTNPQNEDLEIVISLTPTMLNENKMNKKAVNDKDPQRKQPKEVIHYNPGANYVPGVPQEMAEYVKNIQYMISNAIVYPAEAEVYGWEGTVKLGLLILPDGTLAYASIRESSGHEIFDENALNIAKNVVSPYPSFPPNSTLQELDITLPIVYSFNKN